MPHRTIRNIIDIYLPDSISKFSGCHFDYLFIPIGKLIHVDIGILPCPISWLCLHECVLDDSLIELVDVLLRMLHDVEISESPRRILDRKEPRYYEWELAMFIESILISWLIL